MLDRLIHVCVCKMVFSAHGIVEEKYEAMDVDEEVQIMDENQVTDAVGRVYSMEIDDDEENVVCQETYATAELRTSNVQTNANAVDDMDIDVIEDENLIRLLISFYP